MKHTFISDLDGTLVYSREPKHICVEHIGEREITFVTKDGLDKMEQLFRLVSFVPCSIRTYEQIMRIDFIRNYKPQHIIACNGASIFINGELDIEWDKAMRQIIPMGEILKLQELITELKLPTTKISNISDYFLIMCFNNHEEAVSYIDIVKKIVPNEHYIVFCIRKKLYILNKNINKANAVKYLINKYDLGNIYTSGDTIADEAFTKLENVKAYIPKHAEFQHKTAYITKSEGIYSQNEIINKILDDINNINMPLVSKA